MKFSKLVIALGLGATVFGASAQTVSQNMAVSATINGSCTIVANALSFSVYNPASATALNAESTAVITCSTGAGTVLSVGLGAQPLTTQRRLRVGATTNYLNYNVYQPVSTAENAACDFVTPWGAGTAPTGGANLAIGGAPAATSRTYRVCGQIPALQGSAPGTYVDAIAITATL